LNSDSTEATESERLLIVTPSVVVPASLLARTQFSTAHRKLELMATAEQYKSRGEEAASPSDASGAKEVIARIRDRSFQVSTPV